MTKLQSLACGAAAAIFIWIMANPAHAQAPRLGPECPMLKSLGQHNKALIARIKSIRIGNKQAWCPLTKQLIVNNDAMLRIFDNDPERCGVRDDIISNLQSVTERAAQNMRAFAACGN